jgi:hypothetical protein
MNRVATAAVAPIVDVGTGNDAAASLERVTPKARLEQTRERPPASIRVGFMGAGARPWIRRLVSWRPSTGPDGLSFRRHLPLPPSV